MVYYNSDGNNLQSLGAIEPKPPDIPIVPEKVSLKEKVDNDLLATLLNVTVAVLMAGAIFAIDLIFLQCMSLHPHPLIIRSSNKYLFTIRLRDLSDGFYSFHGNYLLV